MKIFDENLKDGLAKHNFRLSIRISLWKMLTSAPSALVKEAHIVKTS